MFKIAERTLLCLKYDILKAQKNTLLAKMVFNFSDQQRSGRALCVIPTYVNYNVP